MLPFAGHLHPKPQPGKRGLLYTPRHFDYGPVHISGHFPEDIVDKPENLYRIGSIEDIEARLPEGDALFSFACAKLWEIYDFLNERRLYNEQN